MTTCESSSRDQILESKIETLLVQISNSIILGFLELLRLSVSCSARLLRIICFMKYWLKSYSLSRIVSMLEAVAVNSDVRMDHDLRFCQINISGILFNEFPANQNQVILQDLFPQIRKPLSVNCASSLLRCNPFSMLSRKLELQQIKSLIL